MVIESRNSVDMHYFDTKSLIWLQIFIENLSIIIIMIVCWSGFMAMWSGIATPEQAERMVKENLLDEKAFWAPYGVRTLSKYEKMYTIKASGNPSYWLEPIWTISNYIVFKGLVKYGFNSEAEELAEKI